MFRESFGEREEQEDLPVNNFEDAPGNKAEKIVVEFLKESFPDIIMSVVETGKGDQNDGNGIDFVCELKGGYKFAVDLTFNDQDMRNKKMQMMANDPLATYVYPGGKSENMPRVLLFERNMGSWLDYGKKLGANTKLVSIMDKGAKKVQQIRFLETVIQQARGIPTVGKKGVKMDLYKEKMDPIAEICQRELELLNAA